MGGTDVDGGARGLAPRLDRVAVQAQASLELVTADTDDLGPGGEATGWNTTVEPGGVCGSRDAEGLRCLLSAERRAGVAHAGELDGVVAGEKADGHDDLRG
jgi:hypothetical protein